MGFSFIGVEVAQGAAYLTESSRNQVVTKAGADAGAAVVDASTRENRQQS